MKKLLLATVATFIANQASALAVFNYGFVATVEESYYLCETVDGPVECPAETGESDLLTVGASFNGKLSVHTDESFVGSYPMIEVHVPGVFYHSGEDYSYPTFDYATGGSSWISPVISSESYLGIDITPTSGLLRFGGLPSDFGFDYKFDGSSFVYVTVVNKLTLSRVNFESTEPAPVPLPAGMTLMLSGLAALGASPRRLSK